MRVFLQESVVVSRPFDEIEDRFVGDGRWLEPLASAAEEDGEALYVRVGTPWTGGPLARKVRVTLGPPHNRGQAIVVPLSWKATTTPRLFPVLEGDLEVAPLGSDQCRLTLTASYEPPLGELGHRLDKALLHNVANSTVGAFLARVAEILDDTHGSVHDLRPGWD